MSFVKQVSSRTIEVMRKARPLLPRFQVFGGSVRLERYPMTLGNWLDEGGNVNLVEERIKKMVDDLHGLGILHGDLHAENIAINPETMDMRLIDLDGAYYIEELDEDTTEKIRKFWSPETPLSTVKDLMEYERNEMWKVGYC
jgi:tRNA A-37 threonylcarbamoyl transferase component Bud32